MTVTPAGDGVPLLIGTITILAVSWVTLVARLAVRKWLKPEAMGMDDYLMCVGLILYTVTCSLVISCCFYGAGQRAAMLTPAIIMQGTKLFFIAQFFYASCTVFIKCSICVTMLRVADARRRFVYSLYVLIGLSILASLVFMIAIANICHPIHMLWGETTEGTCNTSLNSNIGYFFSAMSILTDWSLAFLPMMLLWKLQMKRRVKVSVAIMLGLAAFASCATIIRLRFLTLYNDQAEFMYSTGEVGLWSVIEEGIGITAGSMPALRPVLSLSVFGRSTNHGSHGDSHPLSEPDTFRKMAKTLQTDNDDLETVKMETFRSSLNNIRKKQQQGGFEDGDSDGDSQKQILKETHVVVTAEYQTSTAANEWDRQQVLGWKISTSK